MVKETRQLIEDIKPLKKAGIFHPGIVEITLEEGVKVKVVGLVYGIEHSITGDNYHASLFIDHYNRRIRVLNYEGSNLESLVLRIRWIAEANQFDKIIFMASSQDWQFFLSHGYVLEAVIKYCRNGRNAYAMSKFRSQERLTSQNLMEEILLIENLMSKKLETKTNVLGLGHECRLATLEDIPQLVELYATIFESYPSPLTHADYLKTVFDKKSIFCVVTYEGKVVAAASGEMNHSYRAAELTDCATLKSFRGLGLMTVILTKIEQELIKKGFVCGFTMARARSFGMNNVFYQMGYEFMGRLVNNCDIYGAYEDMNIWVRILNPASSESSKSP